MVRDNGLLGAKQEMHREVIVDLKLVYYRGRFRASTAWSRIGKGRAAENSSKVDPEGISKAGVTPLTRQTRQGLRPIA